MTLEEYIARDDWSKKEKVTLELGALPKNAIDNLRKLQRLGLLTDEAVLCLVGQAPIDPYGIFGALQSFGPWALQPLDFTAISILAKKGAQPVALMRIDLLSDDLTFVVLHDKQLVQHSGVTGDEMMRRLAMPGMKASMFTAWLRGQMKAAVDAGLAAPQ
jgi:hypothetical protein